VRDRIARAWRRIRSRTTPAQRHPYTPAAAPLWVRGLTAGGRPLVLGVALLMCAPGEVHLARAAGWSHRWAYGMPVVLSAYAGIAAAVASTRRRGDRGRWSAIIGAAIALSLAVAAQIVSHLIARGMMSERQAILVAGVSLVPPAVVGHLLHLAATPPGHAPAPVRRQDAPAVPAATPAPANVPTAAVITPPPLRVRTRRTARQRRGAAAPPTRRTPTGTALMSTSDVARASGVRPSTVRNWVARGQLAPARTDARGHHWFEPSAVPRRAALTP
jgi:MerR HTH family regulatory protein